MNQPGEIPMTVYKAIARFEQAIELSIMKGMYPPENHSKIEEEYRLSKESLLLKIRKVVK